MSIYTKILQKIEALSADFLEVKDQIQQLQVAVTRQMAWHIKEVESDAESLGDRSSSCSRQSARHEGEVTVLHHQLLKKDRELEELKHMIYEREDAPPSNSQQSSRASSPARDTSLLSPLQPLPRNFLMTHGFSTSLRQCCGQLGHAPLQQDKSHEKPALRMPRDENQSVYHYYPERPPRARDFCTISTIGELPLRTAPVHRRWCEHHSSITHNTSECRATAAYSRKVQKQLRRRICFNCRRPGHLACECPFPVSQYGRAPSPTGKVAAGSNGFWHKSKSPSFITCSSECCRVIRTTSSGTQS